MPSGLITLKTAFNLAAASFQLLSSSSASLLLLPLLQEVESDRVKGHIATMAKRLTRALAMINPAPVGEGAGLWRWLGVSSCTTADAALPAPLRRCPA